MLRMGRRALAAAAACVMAATAASAQVKELRIGYQPSPIQDASIAMFETWGAKKGIKIVKVPNSYGVYVEKMTASLTSNSDQYDVIWHNDDWGQLWAHLLEPTDDIEALKYAEKWGMDKVVFGNAQGQNTVVPMGQTFSVFFYRSDLVKPEEVPKTLAELVETSKKLQAANKVKFGYVGGMAMNHSWFSWLWSMWGNNCDVLTEPCMKETVEYWWDAINTHKISPRGMPAYDRNEANAIFMGGDAAFTVADSLWWGTFNDPAKSKMAGKIAAARFPLGPNRKEPFAWDDIWGWAIPKSISPERKALAKEMLAAMMVDKEGQMKMFKATGAPPPNTEFWPEIAAADPFMKLLKESVLDSPNKVRGAYYFPNWPAVHKAFNDTVTKAVTGKREDIAKVLADGAPSVSKAAQ
jgi:ABC-type glycerol-3-phosphate transport system substrate-binding protein